MQKKQSICADAQGPPMKTPQKRQNGGKDGENKNKEEGAPGVFGASYT